MSQDRDERGLVFVSPSSVLLPGTPPRNPLMKSQTGSEILKMDDSLEEWATTRRWFFREWHHGPDPPPLWVLRAVSAMPGKRTEHYEMCYRYGLNQHLLKDYWY